MESSFIDHISALVEKEGADVWWKYSEEQLLPPEYVRDVKERGGQLPTKGTDIMDIWFDSGSSWYCAMEGKMADMYLEGHDQTNGWFQSSLLISVAATGIAPYKTLFLHGFTVDEHFQKMSKSLKNVFDPELITNGGKNLKKSPAFGVNVLRWWALSSTPVNDVPFGMEVILSCENDIKAIRNTFFFLGALNKFNPQNPVELAELRLHDQYVLSQVKPYLEKVWELFESLEYEKIAPFVYNFIVEKIGNEYMNSVKDILYFESENSLKRKSIQTTLYFIIPYLLHSLSPILPHLTEEVLLFYDKIKGEARSSQRCPIEPPSEWSQFERVALYEQFRPVHEALVEKWQEKKIIEADSTKHKVYLRFGKSLEQIIRILQSSDKDNHSELCSILRVSEVITELDHSLEEKFELEVSPADGSICARCRKFAASKNELCTRCENVCK